jgi:hypothetical protein
LLPSALLWQVVSPIVSVTVPLLAVAWVPRPVLQLVPLRQVTSVEHLLVLLLAVLVVQLSALQQLRKIVLPMTDTATRTGWLARNFKVVWAYSACSPIGRKI